jgi:hypothetical protein
MGKNRNDWKYGPVRCPACRSRDLDCKIEKASTRTAFVCRQCRTVFAFRNSLGDAAVQRLNPKTVW